MARVVGIEQDYEPTVRYVQTVRDRYVYGHSTFLSAPPTHTLARCFNADAVPETVYRAIKDNDVHFITGSGHGAFDAFTGHLGVPLLESFSVSADLVKGKIIHLLSCRTGATLGLACVQSGAVAYWGYSTDFTFPPSEELGGDNSALAEAFIRMDALIDRGILAGLDANEIYTQVTRYFWNVYNQLVDRGSQWQSAFLDNFVHLVCPTLNWGDPIAVLP